jgi:DNA-directed RNA polymerase specialized sigma24 family protein
MKSCANCKRRNRCDRPCAGLEAHLPKDYTGRDPKVEVLMAPADLEVLADAYSYELWIGAGSLSRKPEIDLSRLTAKEKNALMLLAIGMSMRGAAKRLGINLNALQCRVASARKKLSAGQFPYPVKGGGLPPRGTKGDGR